VQKSSITFRKTRGGCSLSQLSLGERRGTPWTGRQSITGPHRDTRDKQPSSLTLTAKDTLESPINLTCMFLDGGRKPEYPERTHAYPERTHAYTERTHAYTGRTCKAKCISLWVNTNSNFLLPVVHDGHVNLLQSVGYRNGGESNLLHQVRPTDYQE